jgi:hypothetical protein
MTIVYIIAGVFAGFLLFIIAGYMVIAYALIGNETQALDETQKVKCQAAMKAGKGSLMCHLYVKKGRCPHQPCPNISGN